MKVFDEAGNEVGEIDQSSTGTNGGWGLIFFGAIALLLIIGGATWFSNVTHIDKDTIYQFIGIFVETLFMIPFCAVIGISLKRIIWDGEPIGQLGCIIIACIVVILGLVVHIVGVFVVPLLHHYNIF